MPEQPTPAFTSNPQWQQAQRCLARRQPDGARKALAALRADGRHVHACLVAAQLTWQEGHVRDCAAKLLEAASAVPDEPAALFSVANPLLEAGEIAAARAILNRPTLTACTEPFLLLHLATLHRALGQQANALAALDKAKQILEQNHATPGQQAPILFLRGMTLTFTGQLDEAEHDLAASLMGAPGRGTIAVPLVRLRKQTPDHNYLAAIEAGAPLAKRGSDDEAAFEFARYKTFEDLGQIDAAWKALAHGNELMHARLDAANVPPTTWLDRLTAAWSAVNPTTTVTQNGPQPIFIVGMPRSGTSVLERMLGNNSRVAVAGELWDFQQQVQWATDTHDIHGDRFLERIPDVDCGELGRRYLMQTQWRAQGKDYFIDKQPPNWVWAGGIHAALPGARILHMVRDPMDTCFSNFRAYFGNACAYSYALPLLATYFHRYRQTVARWHELIPGAIMDVSYNQLVSAPEATLRKVFVFCGLDWEPDCTDITRNTAPSATPSSAQVRLAVNRHGLGEWRRYEAQLQPLADALTDARSGADAR